MCGRFANHIEDAREWVDLLSDWPREAVTGFNISPSQLIPAFTQHGGMAMRWGLIPNWSAEISSKYSTFNARLESVQSKPAFRHAWKQGQRCLVPALGYYEWRKEGQSKQPYFIRPSSGSPLVMAGLWEPARGAIAASCTILTVEASGPLAEIHPRRPLFVERSRVEEWFGVEPSELATGVADWPSIEMQVYPVSRAVNDSRSNGSHLVEAID